MGPAVKTKTPKGAHVIDLARQTIIPGSINLHSHIGENTAARIRETCRHGQDRDRRSLRYRPQTFSVKSALP
jgi:imidazolonepropionase-like amidohydrolase